jgi:hypothetical protein
VPRTVRIGRAADDPRLRRARRLVASRPARADAMLSEDEVGAMVEEAMDD